MVGLAGGVLSFLVYGLVDAVTLGAKPSGALWAMRLRLPVGLDVDADTDDQVSKAFKTIVVTHARHGRAQRKQPSQTMAVSPGMHPQMTITECNGQPVTN